MELAQSRTITMEVKQSRRATSLARESTRHDSYVSTVFFFFFLHIIIVFTFYMSFCKYIMGNFPSPMLGRLKNLIMSHYLTSSNSIHRFTTMFAQTAFHGTAAHTHFSAIANPVKLFQNSKTTTF